MKLKQCIAASVLGLLASAPVYAKKDPTQYAVGFQASFPASGISGKMKITNEITGQVILGPMGSLNTYAARGLYKIKEEKDYNTYGYGMLGLWTYDGIDSDVFSATFGQPKTESTIGVGAGAGIEYNWQAFAPTLPPVWWNIEAGLGMIKFKEVNYNVSTFMFGGGVHYRF